MDEINLLADKIEQAIRNVFAHAAEHESGMWNYALLFDSKKSENWVVVLFFKDKIQLKKSLNNTGFCYWINKFLENELTLIDEQLLVDIRFGTGEYPSNDVEYEHLLENHIKIYDTLKNEEGKEQVCSRCGHDWGKHKLCRIGDVLEGWMTCPEEDCFCFMTWDTPITKKDK